ncbi:aldo/keto reductase [Deltaproteobacteria bacterium Smac51]|nr:aldo/keto reductase [Deltaproteobacteria bacterium Smac51]
MFNIKNGFQLSDGSKIPRLGLGFWRMSPEETPAALTAALEAGYRLFDTASYYQNEAELGQVLSQSGFPREELYITTKVWNDEQGYESTLAACRRSLGLLKLEYLDLYLLHWPVAGRTEDTWRALEKLRADGLVRSLGVCNFDVPKLEKLLSKASIRPAVNQVEIHPLKTSEELRQWCIKEDIQVEAFAPLARGKVFEAPVIKKLAARYNRTPAQIVLRWEVQNGLVAIPKSAHPVRIRENADIDGFSLNEQELNAIAALNEDKSIISAAYNFDEDGYVIA